MCVHIKLIDIKGDNDGFDGHNSVAIIIADVGKYGCKSCITNSS